VLTDVMFVDQGRVVFSYEADDFESHFFELTVAQNAVDEARALRPMHERQSFGRTVFLYRDVEVESIAALGEVRTPSIEEVFAAVIERQLTSKHEEVA
jgi:ABC-2 type transport system ATP-binding protein